MHLAQYTSVQQANAAHSLRAARTASPGNDSPEKPHTDLLLFFPLVPHRIRARVLVSQIEHPVPAPSPSRLLLPTSSPFLPKGPRRLVGSPWSLPLWGTTCRRKEGAPPAHTTIDDGPGAKAAREPLEWFCHAGNAFFLDDSKAMRIHDRPSASAPPCSSFPAHQRTLTPHQEILKHLKSTEMGNKVASPTAQVSFQTAEAKFSESHMSLLRVRARTAPQPPPPLLPTHTHKGHTGAVQG